MAKIKCGLYDGERISFTDQKAHLPDPKYPNPQEHASAQDGQNMSGGRGSGESDMGKGISSGSAAIDNSGAARHATAGNLEAGSARGLAAPFGSTDTKG